MTEVYTKINENGEKCYYKDKEMKILHREDGPAIESSETKIWCVDGIIHREDGPAIETKHSKEWLVNGKRHRTDGPAIELVNGICDWYVDGIEYEPLNDSDIIEINGKKFIKTSEYKI